MRALAGFLIRLVAYAVALGVVSRIAEYLWVQRGLDGSITLQPLHDAGITTLVIAPIVLAIVGFGRLRPVAIFLATFLIGAALTAPFALARFAGS
jgi:uncharacterized membrane protein YvlD (DUF360 family)